MQSCQSQHEQVALQDIRPIVQFPLEVRITSNEGLSLHFHCSFEALLADCLQVLAPEPLSFVPEDLERRLSMLLEHLRNAHVLLVLDNLEALLAEGDVRGHLRPGLEGYGQMLRQVAETMHQSCLLLTSREKPAELRRLEGSRTLVRAMRLAGLDAAACEHLLAEHEVIGSQEELARLIKGYAGTPLALKIVAETIADLFGGEIGPFLQEGTVIFGSLADLLDEQFARLSPLEQTILRWLSIVREPVTLDELLSMLVGPSRSGTCTVPSICAHCDATDLRAPQYHGDQGLDPGAEGHVAGVGGDRREHTSPLTRVALRTVCLDRQQDHTVWTDRHSNADKGQLAFLLPNQPGQGNPQILLLPLQILTCLIIMRPTRKWMHVFKV